MFNFFSKKPMLSVETQLQELGAAGVVLNCSLPDLFQSYAREQLEARPYQTLIEALGGELEREPFTPLCHKLWMCDFERIEDHGSYRDVLLRLEAMHGSGMENIHDFVDVSEEQAWVAFEQAGQSHRWTARVHNDWLDEKILVAYDDWLRQVSPGVRLYANVRDYGQSALLAVFSDAQFGLFRGLSKVSMKPLGS